MLGKINTAYSNLRFIILCRILDTHTIMFFRLYSHNLFLAGICYDVLQDIFRLRIEAYKEKYSFINTFIYSL